jgi:TolA-binding protein
VQASALIGLKQYDEALALLKEFIAGSPPKELAAAAEFNLALIYKDTGKLDEALKTFREIRDKYAGTEQAEQASYWLGEMGLAVDPKQAIIEIKDFIQKHPDSDLAPQALFALARGQVAAGQLADALITFRDLPKKFPKSEPAPFTYFERAKIYANQQKYDECLAVMREFIAEYPDNPAQFQAHDFMAQILASQQKGMESIAIYEDFAKKFAGNPAAAEALLKLSSLWRGYAEQQGPILAQSPEKRTAWAKGVENSLAAVDQIVEKYPESPALALALGNALEIQKSRVRAKLITEADLEKYFGDLATKAEGKPGTQSKIQMTLAAYVSDKDKGKALGMIEKVFDEKLKYAPADLDLYGESLIEAKKYDETIKIYKKIASDYPIPGGVDPTKAPRDIQEAQAIALAGEAKALQGKGEKEASAAKYLELEKNYPWSPKMLEVHYGIALNLHEQGQDEEAIKRLLEVVKAMKAPAKLRADSLLLLGKIHESNKRFDQAIDNYIKIATFYSGVPDAAAEGLWRGAQLLEKQASGEIPRPTPPPRSSASPAPKGSPAPKAEAKPATAKQ